MSTDSDSHKYKIDSDGVYYYMIIANPRAHVKTDLEQRPTLHQQLQAISEAAGVPLDIIKNEFDERRRELDIIYEAWTISIYKLVEQALLDIRRRHNVKQSGYTNTDVIWIKDGLLHIVDSKF